jgi:hypothetical protein
MSPAATDAEMHLDAVRTGVVLSEDIIYNILQAVADDDWRHVLSMGAVCRLWRRARQRVAFTNLHFVSDARPTCKAAPMKHFLLSMTSRQLASIKSLRVPTNFPRLNKQLQHALEQCIQVDQLEVWGMYQHRLGLNKDQWSNFAKLLNALRGITGLRLVRCKITLREIELLNCMQLSNLQNFRSLKAISRPRFRLG